MEHPQHLTPTRPPRSRSRASSIASGNDSHGAQGDGPPVLPPVPITSGSLSLPGSPNLQTRPARSPARPSPDAVLDMVSAFGDGASDAAESPTTPRGPKRAASEDDGTAASIAPSIGQDSVGSSLIAPPPSVFNDVGVPADTVERLRHQSMGSDASSYSQHDSPAASMLVEDQQPAAADVEPTTPTALLSGREAVPRLAVSSRPPSAERPAIGSRRSSIKSARDLSPSTPLTPALSSSGVGTPIIPGALPSEIVGAVYADVSADTTVEPVAAPFRPTHSREHASIGSVYDDESPVHAAALPSLASNAALMRELDDAIVDSMAATTLGPIVAEPDELLADALLGPTIRRTLTVDSQEGSTSVQSHSSSAVFVDAVGTADGSPAAVQLARAPSLVGSPLAALDALPPPAPRSSLEARRSSLDQPPTVFTPTPLTLDDFDTSRLQRNAPLPHAMFCGDIRTMRSAVDRAKAFATKLNALGHEDSGLDLWIALVRTGGAPRRPSATPSDRRASIQHGRSESLAEFPIRGGDLTNRAQEFSSSVTPASPPSLPYPQLAPGRQGSVSSASSVRSVGTSQTALQNRTGLLAALGRRGSRRAMEKPRVNISGPLTETAVRTDSYNSRSLTGPRPPGAPPLPARPSHRSSLRDVETLKSFSTSSASSRSASPQPPYDPAFTEQLRKLEAILPQATTAELVDVLRRAGSDVDAVGLYIDEHR